MDEVRRVDPTEPGREKGGFAEKQLGRLAGCIDRGLDEVKEQQESIREYVEVIEEVAATLEPGTEDVTERQEKFEALIDRFEATEDPIRQTWPTVMLSFLAGLFVGEEEFEEIRDNLDLERWFRLPKSHERRIHGHRHAGVRHRPGRADVGARAGRARGASRAVHGGRPVAVSDGPRAAVPTPRR